jgi:hypothetical protein
LGCVGGWQGQQVLCFAASAVTVWGRRQNIFQENPSLFLGLFPRDFSDFDIKTRKGFKNPENEQKIGLWVRSFLLQKA